MLLWAFCAFILKVWLSVFWDSRSPFPVFIIATSCCFSLDFQDFQHGMFFFFFPKRLSASCLISKPSVHWSYSEIAATWFCKIKIKPFCLWRKKNKRIYKIVQIHTTYFKVTTDRQFNPLRKMIVLAYCLLCSLFALRWRHRLRR